MTSHSENLKVAACLFSHTYNIKSDDTKQKPKKLLEWYLFYILY